MQLDTLNLNDLYQEIAELARAQGISDKSGWDSLCEEALESHADIGELNADQNTQAYLVQLRAMWDEYLLEAGEETPGAISEDPETPRA